MNKYNARRTKIDGITFDSLAESRRYGELKLMQASGDIGDLKVHPRFVVWQGYDKRTGKVEKITYIGDFEYYELWSKVVGAHVVEDVKGVETDVFKIKAKLFRCQYPDLELRIVKMNER